MSELHNPFVLHGSRTPIRERPSEYMSSSEKTLTSRNLSSTLMSSRSSSRNQSRNELYEIEDFNQIPSGIKRKSSKKSEFSLDLGSLNSSLNKSFNKSVSFSEKLQFARDSGVDEDDDDLSLQDEFEAELQKLIAKEVEESEEVPHDFAGNPLESQQSSWFTEPMHLTKNSEFPIFESLGAKEGKISSVYRTSGMIGTELAQKKVASDFTLSEDARLYFPVTLREMPQVMNTVTPPPPGTLNSSSLMLSNRGNNNTPQQQASSDYNYLKASQAFVDQAVVASPYQYELARLKMERLRLEESLLLDAKREDELERIRGPEPKWYELKTPKFSYEHKKNNELLKSKKEWQHLLDYRQKLMKASNDFTSSQQFSSSFS